MLHHTTHPHTEDGKRYDMVVVWKSQQQMHQMLETLEDLVGHGEQL